MAELSLEIVEGPGSGQKQPLAAPVEIGRDPSAELTLDDDLVSRRHVRITPRDGGAVVEDLGSRNGTFVNGNEIHGPTRLVPGDHVLVGVTVLELRTAAQVAQQATAVRPRPPALATPARQPDFVDEKALRAPQAAHRLDPLLDKRTKGKARTAPLAIFVLVVFVVLIFLATR
jgi:pSer/pThr/pTyr-binding forkhead associated (FHA) protein